MKRAARIDENQPDIVKSLRELGASVQPLHGVGCGCPDLLIGYKGRNYLIEIKNPDKPKCDQKLTKDQKKWHDSWFGQKVIIHSPMEAQFYLLQTNGRK